MVSSREGGVRAAGQQLAQVAGLLLGGQQQRGGHQVGGRVGGLGGELPQRAGEPLPLVDAGGPAGDLIADRSGRDRRGGQDRLLQPDGCGEGVTELFGPRRDALDPAYRGLPSPVGGLRRAAGTRPPGRRGSCPPANG